MVISEVYTTVGERKGKRLGDSAMISSRSHQTKGFRLMDVSVSILGLTGIIMEHKGRKRHQKKKKASSAGSSAPANSYMGGDGGPPVKAIVSFFKQVNSSSTSIASHLPSNNIRADPATIISDHNNKTIFTAHWPTDFDPMGNELSTFKFTRMMQIVDEGHCNGKNGLSHTPVMLPEKIELTIGLTRGSEMMTLGYATLIINGDEAQDVQVNLPIGFEKLDEGDKTSKKTKRKAGKGKLLKAISFEKDNQKKYNIQSSSRLKVLLTVSPVEPTVPTSTYIPAVRRQISQDTPETLALSTSVSGSESRSRSSTSRSQSMSSSTRSRSMGSNSRSVSSNSHSSHSIPHCQSRLELRVNDYAAHTQGPGYFQPHQNYQLKSNQIQQDVEVLETMTSEHLDDEYYTLDDNIHQPMHYQPMHQPVRHIIHQPMHQHMHSMGHPQKQYESALSKLYKSWFCGCSPSVENKMLTLQNKPKINGGWSKPRQLLANVSNTAFNCNASKSFDESDDDDISYEEYKRRMVLKKLRKSRKNQKKNKTLAQKRSPSRDEYSVATLKIQNSGYNNYNQQSIDELKNAKYQMELYANRMGVDPNKMI